MSQRAQLAIAFDLWAPVKLTQDIGLEDGLRETYAWFPANQDRYRRA
jgi:hypothetical protein